MASAAAGAAATGVHADADARQRQLLELAAERLQHAEAAKNSSRYDYVKVKVRLGTHLEHYYILSRFLLSRMLTVITLPQHKAVRIALDVKKQLVDHGRLDITQDELEEVLFAVLRQKGFGDEYVSRYQMVTRFFQQKRPLIILIAGSACTGKSSLAQQLASRLNLPNVLQTDVLYELLRSSGIGDLPAEPLWRRPLQAASGSSSSSGSSSTSSSLVAAFQRECTTIRRALDGDLCKCIRDGKSIIIEGLHLDPGLFLREFGDLPGGASAAASIAPEADPLLTVPTHSLELPQLAAVPEAEPEADLDADVEMASSQMAGLQVAENASVTASVAAFATAASAASESSTAHPQTAAAPTGSAEAGAWPSPEEKWPLGVRRAASFSDAVPNLSYSSPHFRESPWKDALSSRMLRRPSSAALRGSLERGQPVFMLQNPASGSGIRGGIEGMRSSVSISGGGGGGGGGGESDGMQPVLSPLLASCVSLPSQLVYSVEEETNTGECQHGSNAVPAVEKDSSSSGDGGGGSRSAQMLPPGQLVPLPAQAVVGRTNGASNDEGVQAAATLNSSSHGSMQQPQPVASGGASPAALQQQQQHGSVAMADAAAAVAAGSGPVFVPICLSVPEGEYEVMLQDWLSRQPPVGGYIDAVDGSSTAVVAAAASGDAGGEPLASDAEAVQRLRQLQEHLRQYAIAGVPVVELDITNMGQALDAMHAYVLRCIALALND